MSIFKKAKFDISTVAGFTVFYKTYVDYLFDICFQYLGDEETSKNITADIFASVWDRRDILRREGLKKDSWKSYLTRAAKNKIVDHFRGKEQIARYLATSAREIPLDECTTDLEVDYKELVEQLSWAVDQLPPKCQQVFRFSREEYLSNKEIAQKLGITDHAVKRHIEIALKKLRMHLDEYNTPKRAAGT